MKKLLVVVDVQNDFVTGSLGSSQAQAVVPNIVKKVMEHHSDVSNVTIFTRDFHDSNYLETDEGKYLPVPHCINGTDGVRLIPELEKIENSIYCTVAKSRFASPIWVDALKAEPYEVTIIGLVTDICVIANAIMIKTFAYKGSRVIVDASCCAGTSEEMHNKALDVMQGLQIEVINR
jgi:nicotinamidase-related amidase